MPAIPAGDVQAELSWSGALARTNLATVIAKILFGIARREKGFSLPAKPGRIDGDAPAAVTPSSPAVLNYDCNGRELYWLDIRGRDTPVRQPVTERPESGGESVIVGA